jgi:hypothetical protein
MTLGALYLMKYVDYDDNGNKNDDYGDCDAIILLTAATEGKLVLLEGAVVGGS